MNDSVLIVEDDADINALLKTILAKEGYEVIQAFSGTEAELVLDKKIPELILLDLMLPGMSGENLLYKIREEKNCKVPVLILSAKNALKDKVNLLKGGADDYITKPFKLAVFLSRVNALLRRSENFNQMETELSSNGITIHRLKGEVYKNGKQIDLTASEYKLLCLFMENPNIVLSPEQILSKLWDCDEKYIDNNTLTVYIRRLRTKVEDNPASPQKIVTVRRMGYKWNTAG